MDFYAHQKVSLVDYPGKIATLLFVSGCNFWCKYCHNAELKNRLEHKIKGTDILEFLKLRRGKIDAVVITGGEPALYKNEVLEFFTEIKKQFPEILTKFDTNGSNPDVFNLLKNVTDFVAMDFKGLDYTLFSNISLDTILKSLENIKVIKDYEIRITMYPEYVKIKEFEKIADILQKVKKVVIQQYVKNSFNNVDPYDDNVLVKFKDILISKKIDVELKI